jgi:hypothetical protein
MESVVMRFPANHINRIWLSYLRGESGFTPNDPFVVGGYPHEGSERRLGLACDHREELPVEILEAGLQRAVQVGVPLLEAQVRRARALARRDPDEMNRALEIWDRVGAVPHQGRGHAEHGLLTGDQAETDAGLAILKKLGDANYVDRFTAQV